MDVPFLGFLICCGGAAACTAQGDFAGAGIALIAALACAGISHSKKEG
jgi:hypothetical protein